MRGERRLWFEFFYLAEDGNFFCMQWYANGNAGTKITIKIMITALLASKYLAMMEMSSGYSVLPYASSGFMNSVFTFTFFFS